MADLIAYTKAGADAKFQTQAAAASDLASVNANAAATLATINARVSAVYATDHGVKADGTTDDTAALQAAVADAAAHGKTLILPAGTILVASTVSFNIGSHTANTQWAALTSVKGQGKNATIIKAKSGGSWGAGVPVVSALETAGVTYEGFFVNANGVADVGIDLRWTGGVGGNPAAAPSCQNRYVDIRAEGAISLDVWLDGNADSTVESGTFGVCSYVMTGGEITMLNTIVSGLFTVGCQNAQITNSQFFNGVVLAPSALNNIFWGSPQIYSNSTSGLCVSAVGNPSGSGAQIFNAAKFNGNTVIAGVFAQGAVFTGCDFGTVSTIFGTCTPSNGEITFVFTLCFLNSTTPPQGVANHFRVRVNDCFTGTGFDTNTIYGNQETDGSGNTFTPVAGAGDFGLGVDYGTFGVITGAGVGTPFVVGYNASDLLHIYATPGGGTSGLSPKVVVDQNGRVSPNGGLGLPALGATGAPNNTLFRDADNILKYRDNSGALDVLTNESTAALRNVTKYLKKDFGAIGDGTTDDTTALTNALAASLGGTPNSWPSGTYVDLVIEPGVYKINPNSVIWDYTRVRIISSSGARIKVMTTSSTDVGIKILGTTPDSSGGLAVSKTSAGLEIVCGNASRVGIGVKVGGVTTGSFADMTTSFRLAASLTLHGLYISGFDKACVLGDNAFMLMFESCAFVACNQGFVVPSGLTNSGERISFSNCNFTDQVTSNTARTDVPQIYSAAHPYIDNQGSDAAGLFFRNCSFDWLAQLLFNSTNSRIYFDQCWFESPFDQMLNTSDSVWGTAAYGVVADHAPVMFNQCKFIIAAVGSGGQPSWTIPYLFSLDPWGKMTVRDSHAYFNTGVTSTMPVVGGVEAWASTPGLRLDGLLYDKPTDGQALDDALHRMPSRVAPQDGASHSYRSYSLDSLDTTGDTLGTATGVGKWVFGSTASGTGTLTNTDLPSGVSAIHNAMTFKDVTQFGVVDKPLGFAPRYMTFDFWAKATGTATQLYVVLDTLVSGGTSVNAYAPAPLTISTTWKRFHIVWDLNHSSAFALQPTVTVRWGFNGVPNGDNSAKIAGMVMDAWA